MPPMRDIAQVINEILPIIEPHYQIPDHPFPEHLRNIREQVRYTAPELQVPYWIELTKLLQQNLRKPDTDWKLQVQAIMKGES